MDCSPAWSHVRSMADTASAEITISGTGIESVDGVYACDFKDWPEGEAPSFRYRTYGRWLYFDQQRRWRVGLMQHKQRRRAGTIGYLRSKPVMKGVLPSAEFIQWEVWSTEENKWSAAGPLCITGMATPAKVLEDYKLLQDAIYELCRDGNIVITCRNLAGAEVTPLQVDIENDIVADINKQKAGCKLIMPDGQLLSDLQDDMLAADMLSGFFDFAIHAARFELLEIRQAARQSVLEYPLCWQQGRVERQAADISR
mmetsp:Transcript_145044/g.263832  ORF Transcript_145044/g.263832 Transcript_145044/m.263832 type:complete len:256 (+) Transcript_145044:57-824(+)